MELIIQRLELTVVYYEKNADGVWEKVNIARDKLSKFDISDHHR